MVYKGYHASLILGLHFAMNIIWKIYDATTNVCFLDETVLFSLFIKANLLNYY